MKPIVYVETTVVSYQTARPSRDLVMAAHQRITHEWWEKCPDRFDLYTSAFVIEEASAGDPVAAQERLAVLGTIPLMDVLDEARSLQRALLDAGAVPPQADGDALHIAIAATGGADYLVTWNLKHLANPTMRKAIDSCCRFLGYDPVIICTPEELLGA
jgi:predicted nucleic acid-binding protein